tara:strand:- start:4869 stop:5663 length:795 start_codon:yes stop_codon:yes gene_type:complete
LNSVRFDRKPNLKINTQTRFKHKAKESNTPMANTTLRIATLALITPTVLAGIPSVSLYNDRADFNLASGGAPMTIETFESESLGIIALPTNFDSGLSASFASGSVTSYIGAGDPHDYGNENTTPNGRNYLGLGDDGFADDGSPTHDTGTYSIAYTFGTTANAFAFDLSGVNLLNSAMGLSITTLNNGQVMDDFFYASDQTFTVRFYGIITDNTFDTIHISVPQDSFGDYADYGAFDDITWGTVPTPSTTTLLAMTTILTTRRRR